MAFLALLAVVYGLVYFTGPKTLEPKLGIDLQGGTRVTLTARTEDGKEPTRSQLDQAKQIIEQRVNGLGVAGSEVVVTGNNLVITVPGQDGAQAKSLGQTARLYVRPVIGAVPATPQPPKPEEPEDDKSTDGTPTEEAAAVIAEQRKLRQAPGDASQQQLEALQQYMSKIGLLADRQRPAPRQRQARRVPGGLLHRRQGGLPPRPADHRRPRHQGRRRRHRPQTGEWVVTLEFKGKAASFWPKYTAQEAPNRTQTAFTLDSRVVSAPAINEPIPGGETRISGSSADPFTEASSNELANVLKYGSLPLSFNASDAETVPATLGLSSLRAGLIAGAIGLIAVFLYALAYYRMLGILTILSLVLSGAMVYGIIVLLGRWIGFTLDLAGIAGLIIGIGMTADSFVVYFERIKDEIREGRSFRSAVPRGWASARRTIWSGNAVSFIAAAVIYILAIGEVRGFAFTLGLTTILDVMVVFLVTHPLVVLASRSSFMSKPSVNGLGAVAEVARERKVAARRRRLRKAGATAAGATSSNPDTDTSEKGSAR